MLEAMSLDATLPQLPLPMTVTLDLCVATLRLFRAIVSPPSSAGAIKLRTKRKKRSTEECNAIEWNKTMAQRREEE